jgi:hypothetical protein
MNDARAYAVALVREWLASWDAITSGRFDLRRILLEEIACERVAEGEGVRLRPGIAGAYLARCAEAGDQAAYDLLSEGGYELDCERPKRPGGRPMNALRDAAVAYLARDLLAAFPELRFSASDATPEGKSAVDLIRLSLEAEGLGVVDSRARDDQAPVSRAMERAVRRLLRGVRYREIFDEKFCEAFSEGAKTAESLVTRPDSSWLASSGCSENNRKVPRNAET